MIVVCWVMGGSWGLVVGQGGGFNAAVTVECCVSGFNRGGGKFDAVLTAESVLAYIGFGTSLLVSGLDF